MCGPKRLFMPVRWHFWPPSPGPAKIIVWRLNFTRCGQPMKGESPLKGCVFVFTGEMGMARAEAQDLAVALGARVTTAVSGRTTHLVVGTEPGASKVAKAKELNVKVIGAEEFIRMTNGARSALETVITTDINSASATTEQACRDEYTDSEEFREEAAGRAPGRGSSGGGGVPWAEKYRPKSAGELIGNHGVISRLGDFLSGKTPQKAVLLSGPRGSGRPRQRLCFAGSAAWRPSSSMRATAGTRAALSMRLGDWQTALRWAGT